MSNAMLIESNKVNNEPGPKGLGDGRTGRGFYPGPLSSGEVPRPKGRGFPRFDELIF
jgi:hypothetical protein